MEEGDGAEERLGGEDGHCGGFDEVLCTQLVSLLLEQKSRGRCGAEVCPLCASGQVGVSSPPLQVSTSR